MNDAGQPPKIGDRPVVFDRNASFNLVPCGHVQWPDTSIGPNDCFYVYFNNTGNFPTGAPSGPASANSLYNQTGSSNIYLGRISTSDLATNLTNPSGVKSKFRYAKISGSTVSWVADSSLTTDCIVYRTADDASGKYLMGKQFVVWYHDKLQRYIGAHTICRKPSGALSVANYLFRIRLVEAEQPWGPWKYIGSLGDSGGLAMNEPNIANSTNAVSDKEHWFTAQVIGPWTQQIMGGSDYYITLAFSGSPKGDGQNWNSNAKGDDQVNVARIKVTLP